MKEFEATLAWRRGDQAFTDLRHSRAHRWRFDGGNDVPASSLPLPDPAAVDREEAHARCHIANSLKGDIVVEGFESCT